MGEGGIEMESSGAAAAATTTTEGEVVVAEVAETTTKKPTRLERRWTLWFDNQSKPKQGAAWGSSLRKVYSFDTVEDFWSLYDQIIRPSKLPGNADFHLFKDGVEPKWEDPECANGGKWSVNCSRKTNLDPMWLETLMALIGEQFDESEEICGVVASVRQRQDKLALWTKTAPNEATQMSIGRKWKEIIDINEKMTYSFHDDAKREKSAKARYYNGVGRLGRYVGDCSMCLIKDWVVPTVVQYRYSVDEAGFQTQIEQDEVGRRHCHLNPKMHGLAAAKFAQCSAM